MRDKVAKIHKPNDTSLPYFAYDAFKPKQVAFPVIKYFVDKVEPFEFKRYALKHRNGLPMAVEDYCDASLKGYLIYFNDNTVSVYNKSKEEDEDWGAYDFICKTKPKSLFKWRNERIEDKDFNIILGKNRNYGVYYSEDDGIYDGARDSDFFEVIYFIQDNLRSMIIDYEDMKTLYNLQMNYMLLWSAIDKYLALCNGGWFQHKNVVEWSKSDEFKEIFEKSNLNRYHEVHSSNGASTYKLNPHNSKTSAEYYYQLRCNIVHSGKKHPTDIAFLESSLNELLHIFKEVLEISFDPVRYDEYDLGEW